MFNWFKKWLSHKAELKTKNELLTYMEEDLKRLKAQLAAHRSAGGRDFYSVAKPLSKEDARAVLASVRDAVVHDLSPILQEHAVRGLVQVFAGYDESNQFSPCVLVAAEQSEEVLVVEVKLPAITTRVHARGSFWRPERSDSNAPR